MTALMLIAAVAIADETLPISPPSLPEFSVDTMGHPDALLVTKKLSDFPKDVVSRGVIKHLLTDEFAFFYHESEGYLSLKGSLKRIAYEHELTLFDRLLTITLNQPAEVAFWKSYNGKLKHFMAIFDKSVFSSFLVAIAKISSNDSQLKKITDGDGTDKKIAVYEMKYGNNRSIFIASFEKKVALFSDSRMLLPTAAQLKTWTEKMPKPSGAKEGTFLRLFENSAPKAKHSVYLSMKYLSFGYQKYFPVFEKLKFSFSPSSGWETQGLFRGGFSQAGVDGQAIWKATPLNPSLCSLLPLDVASVRDLVAKTLEDTQLDLSKLAGAFRSPVAACWYGKSQLFSPMFITKVDKSVTPEIAKLIFEKVTGNFEAGVSTPAAPVSESKFKNGIVLSREVSSRYGTFDSEKSKYSEKMRSRKYFNVRLALWKNHLIFSPDSSLVDNAIAVIDKKYPAVADSLPGQAQVGLVVSPIKLSELLRKSTLESLPDEQESVFRESVSKRLFPVFDRMKKLPNYSVIFPNSNSSSQDKWEDLKWQSSSVK